MDYQDGFQEEEPVVKRSFLRTQLPLMVQVAVCLIITASALVLKGIGGIWYAAAAEWFFDNYSNSIFAGSAESPFTFLDPTVITETSIPADSTVPESSV